MGELFEKPVQTFVEQGYKGVQRYVEENGAWMFFFWLSLIFLKTHLKDKALRLYQDRRKGEEKIADLFEWELLHHIHCVVRAFYTGAAVAPEVRGSFLVLPMQVSKHWGAFDYGNIHPARSTFIHLGDLCLIAVLDDATAAMSVYADQLARIEGPLSPLQMREIFARLSYANWRLKNRPEFMSLFDSSGYRIICKRPETIELDDPKPEEFGEVFYSCSHQILHKLANQNRDEIIDHVREGRYSFLFDGSGHFIRESMVHKD